MGFIENLRWQKECPIPISRGTEKPENVNEAWLKEKHALAQKYYLSSAFPKLVEGLVEFGGYSKIVHGIGDRDMLEAVYIALEKKFKTNHDNKPGFGWSKYLEVEEHRIEINIKWSGEIEIIGDERRGGATRLWPRQWENNPDIQEEALKKAFLNPRRSFYREPKPGIVSFGLDWW